MSIKFENTEVTGWEAAIRGMRNPLNSWKKSDSLFNETKDFDPDDYTCNFKLGENDFDLMKRIRNAGTDHRKFMRMITVYVDITAPLYWWKEFDTYKVGTVANSCSTMHKIHSKPFKLDDFSHEHLEGYYLYSLKRTIEDLNEARDSFDDFDGFKYRLHDGAEKKDFWWQMIQLLPSSYNQKRTVMMNYEVLANIYKSRKNHKLDEWAEHKESEENKKLTKNFSSGKWGFCDWIKTLPYSELITGEFKEE